MYSVQVQAVYLMDIELTKEKRVEVTAQEVAEAEVAIKHVLSLNADIQQHRTCTLVSKLWNTVIVTNGGCSTLTLRIEDVVIITNINKNKKKTDDDEDKEEEEEDDEMRMIRIPLHSIGRLPSYVTTKTTKLILVLKLSKEHESKYNLNDFMFDGKSNNKQIYFLDRFPILQDLIIYSEFALDQYVSILSTNPKNNGIATLKSIVYEETNVSNWRQSNLQAFVKLAPNLESLILRENMYWKWNNDGRFLQQDSLQELLPLRNSLRKLVLFNRLNIVIDNDNSFNSFISQMPLLKSWDLSCNNPTNTSIPIIVLTTPTTTTTTNNINNDDNNNSTINKNMKQQTYDDNSYRGYDLNDRNKHYYKYVEEEVEFIIIMQDVIVRWYIELHDIHTHPWGDGTRNHILLMIRYLDALVHEFFGNSQYIFDEERPNRPYILPSLQNLLLETTSTAGGGGGGGGGGGTLYPKYCSSYSRNKIILHNYHQVVKPCIQIYHKEFKLYLEGNGFGYKYNTCQKLHQRYQLWRLTKRISHVYDYNRSIIMIRRSRKYRNTGFTVLV
ncbi:hypothetical protein FRACYDRAFT_238295 [Fragilariopsis cylindrus CCMP1102]|uniref:Uncharacterized protein n=1 Tax=Fragilariopsis cylindrus CCMP1102 TaxID=635003 RepID=A0A1E7FIA3_9STRA|nr:hypothetical protein FRACYDRAFT_238295 [Fragilariopsis cylindrus CCMP1102]|eukprot:OEU17867.1 hypothetical protein FRACYDRAFT_238295 [Fragilariopsis cylindrus CCMP1102]